VRRWTRRLTLVAPATLILAAAGPPSAYASCPDLDIVCSVDEAVGAGEQLATDTIASLDTPARGAADPVIDTVVDPVVDPVVDTVVDPVVDTVKPVVDDVLGLVENPPGGGQVDPPDLGGGGGSHVSGPPAGEEPPGTQSPADPGGRSVFGGRSPDGAGLTGSAGPTISAASGTAPPAGADRTSGNRFGEALGGVARSLAIVLALFGLAVAFVAVQDRLDRSDPRLALAPVESDVVEFA
jgi:hypothetical protein